MWPSAALKVKLNTVEPIRMKSTKVDSRVVLSRACFSSVMLSWPRLTAMINAPSAPIAPPSVGVATPRKIVPRTRKISTSGGISTKVTRSASFDSRPSPSSRLAPASASARKDAIVIDRMKISSPGAGSDRSSQGFRMLWCTCDQPQPATAHIASSSSSDTCPLAPFDSR
jgi:hypothetical protein